MKTFKTWLGAAALCLAAAPATADTVQPGFDLTPGQMPSTFSFWGTTAVTLPSGDVITFDGQSVDRWTSGGGFVMNLGSTTAAGYTTWMVLSPDGSEVVFADSGDGSGPGGDVWRAQVDGSGLSHVLALVSSYDAEFLSDGDLIVTADLTGGGNGNDLIRLDLSVPSATPIGFVDGPSGPIAVRKNGNVYYATQSFDFPTPTGFVDILSWTSAQVSGGTFLDVNNASLFASGYDGGSAFVADPINGGLFLAENVYDNNFALVSAKVKRVRPGAGVFEEVVDSSLAIGALEIANTGGGAANFRAYQPADGSNLLYSTTDFFSQTTRNLVVPKRPILNVSGPGTLGIGSVTLTMTGGVPDGAMYLTFAPQDQMTVDEETYLLPGFLWHTYFGPGTTRRMGFYLSTDSNGDGSFTFWNPGSLIGLYGYQMLVTDAGGTFLGSSTQASF